MCTVVVGGSIHRAATRVSAASDQRTTTPMTSHRIKDRRKPVRNGVLVCVFGIAVKFQNNSPGWLPLMDILHARTQSAVFYSEIEHDPCWRMVARVFLPTRPSVNTAVHEPV